MHTYTYITKTSLYHSYVFQSSKGHPEEARLMHFGSKLKKISYQTKNSTLNAVHSVKFEG